MFRPVSPAMPVMPAHVLRPMSPMINPAPMQPLIPYMGRSISPVGGRYPLVGPGIPGSIMHPGPPLHAPIMFGLPNYIRSWNYQHTKQFDENNIKNVV